MNPFTYIGYGCIVSPLPKGKVEVTSSKAYKALKGYFLDSITVEHIDPNNPQRMMLNDIYIKNCIISNNGIEGYKKNVVLVVPTVETFGDDIEAATKEYFRFLRGFHVIILNRPDLSTITLDGEVLVELNDINKREVLKTELALTKLKNRGRKANALDAKFRKVFWAWQNFFITTEDALSLLNMARATFFSLSKTFMIDEQIASLYYEELRDNLEDYIEKPIRGIVLSEVDKKLIIRIHRHIGSIWSEAQFLNLVVHDFNEDERALAEKCLYNARDIIRLRLNVSEGRAAMARCSKKYNRGPEYIEKLRKELENM